MEQMVNEINNGYVPVATIVIMVIVAALTVVIPIGGCVYLKKKYNCKLKAFLCGALVWLIFASVFENVIHSVILSSNAGAVITGNIWLYALYGGLMAAVFEETGRYYGMKYIAKSVRNNDRNAFMYGLGHGGFEAIYVVGLAMVSNVFVAVMINNKTIGPTLDALLSAGESSQNSIEGILQLITYPSAFFVLSIVERIITIVAHIAMSIPVWFAVKKQNLSFYFVSFGMHFVLDFVYVVAASFISSAVLVEVIGFFVTAGIVAISYFIFKKNAEEVTEEPIEISGERSVKLSLDIEVKDEDKEKENTVSKKSISEIATRNLSDSDEENSLS